MARDYVVVTWDGKGRPFPLIAFDAEPDFELAAFCYLGQPDAAPDTMPRGVRLFAHRTQCKGECFTATLAELEALGGDFGYVALIDDDIEISVSGINAMLADAHAHGYGSFSASLTADSERSHHRFVQRPGGGQRQFDWIEVMAPFLRWELWQAAGPLIAGNTSSYGIDQFVMPMLQKLLNLPGAVIYDTVTMRHARPITSDGKVFANGLTAHQERVCQREICLAHLAREAPELVGTPWWFGWAAPWNGPLRFLAPRLWQPFAPLWRAWRQRQARASAPRG